MKKVIPALVTPARLKAARFAGDDYGVTDEPDWRDIDWGEHLHRIEIEGTEVNYVDIGEQGRDRPMVFVHGLAGQWQNWLENIPRFAQSRRVIALDLPGFGQSGMPTDKLSIEGYGHVLAELCDRLDLNPAVLVGNSMGGFVAAELAVRRADSVERLLLVSSAGVSQMDVAKRPILAGAKAAGLVIHESIAQQKWLVCRPALRHVALLIVARHPSRIQADMAYEGLIKGAGTPGFEAALRACLEYDFRDRLPQIGCPVLVVWGEKDAIIPVKDADTFVEMIEGARKIVMEDTGHIPMVERAPTFNDTLQEFLEHDVVEGELEDELDEPRPGPHGGYDRAAEPAA
jgi:pimeloyl-ACP methyl ester carboxylesterase